jgi:type I restriction enzyme S subunit
MILRADPSKIEPRYLLYYVNSPDIKRGLLQRTHGATRDALTKGQMEAFEVDYPPLPIQRRIADILGALDDKIELNRRMNRTLEEMAQTLYYRLFDGSVGGKGTRLDELVNIKPRMPVPDDDEVLTYVGMADVEPNRMSVTDYGEKEYTSGRRFINGDTLMARITPSLENGKTAFVDFLDEREMAFGSTEFTVMRAEEGTSSCFVYCCARDEDFREYAISTMTGSSGRQRVQEDLLGEYAFEGFSQERMEVFHEKAAPLFNLISSNTSENCTLAETRDYLLPKLISGEVEVGDAIRTGPSTA